MGGFGRRDFRAWRCGGGGGRGVRCGLELFAAGGSSIMSAVMQ